MMMVTPLLCLTSLRACVSVCVTYLAAAPVLVAFEDSGASLITRTHA